MENLSQRVKELRTTLGLNVSEFAKKMEIRHQNIAIIEIGTSKPGAEILGKISETFGVNLNWLVNGRGEMFENGKTPELTPTPIKAKELKPVVGNEIVDVGFWQKTVENLRELLATANAEKSKLWARLDKVEYERDMLQAK